MNINNNNTTAEADAVTKECKEFQSINDFDGRRRGLGVVSVTF